MSFLNNFYNSSASSRNASSSSYTPLPSASNDTENFNNSFEWPDYTFSLTEIVRDCTSSVFSAINTFTDGYVFQGLYGALKENIVEYSGWYSVVVLDVDTCSQVSGLALAQLGMISSGAALASTAATYLLAHQGYHQESNSYAKVLNVACTISTAISVRFFTVDALTILGGTSKFFANQVGSMAGGILGGYAGIRLMGSEEPLFNPRSLMHCYTVKCIQCFIGGGVIDTIRPEMGPLTNFLTDQITGSLIYTAVDITNFVHSYTAGQALNEALPSIPTPQGLRNIATGALTTRLTGAIATEAAQRIGLNAILINSTTRLPMNMIQRGLFRLVASQIEKVLSDANISPDHLFQRELERQFRPITEELIHLQENHIQLIELGLSPAIRLLVNATNIHMNRLIATPRINTLYEQINHATSRYVSTFSFSHTMVGGNRDAEETRAQLITEINQLKIEISTMVFEEMQSGLCNKILYKLVNKEFDTESPLWGALYARIQGLPSGEAQAIIKNYIKSLFASRLEDILKPIRAQMQDTLRGIINPQQSENGTIRQYENLSHMLIQNLQNVEVQVLGFSVTSERQAFVIEQILDLHTPLLVTQMMVQGLKLDLVIEETNIRQFYTTINNLLCGQYSSVLGSVAAEALRTRIEFQILNSTLTQ